MLPLLGYSASQALQPLELVSETASSPEIDGEDSAWASSILEYVGIVELDATPVFHKPWKALCTVGEVLNTPRRLPSIMSFS